MQASRSGIAQIISRVKPGLFLTTSSSSSSQCLLGGCQQQDLRRVTILPRMRRRAYSTTTPPPSPVERVPSSSLSLFVHPGFDETWRAKFEASFLVYEDFVTEDEEQSLLREVEPHLQRQVYQKDHWDDAISGFRETERKHWNPANEKTLLRVRRTSFRPQEELLSNVHVLDLSAAGHIKPHIDSSRFCGDTVAVLSLLSACVARFRLDKDREGSRVDCLVPRRSLYVMRDSARHDFAHEILANEESRVGEKLVEKGRRISIVCRCAPK